MRDPRLVAAGVLFALSGGIVIGVNMPNATPEACISALDQADQQQTRLESILPVAVDAVEAAADRSVSRLNAATAELAIIKADIAKAKASKDAAASECRG